MEALGERTSTTHAHHRNHQLVIGAPPLTTSTRVGSQPSGGCRGSSKKCSAIRIIQTHWLWW